MKLLTFILILIASTAFGQKQGNIWYFGDGAGVDFNSGIPVAISGGQTYLGAGHCEGTSSICDSFGSLLFYTNGEKIWDRNNQIMPNGGGLLGHYSSTQSSLIVPQPGSNTIYYLFTTDSWFENALANGLRYSKIDMCLNNEFGDVVPGTKNTILLDTVSEKLIAVRHANGSDYWIITHKYYTSEFYTFLLTASGIADTIISNTGSVHEDNCTPPLSSPTRAAIGQMKASPDGTKLALVNLNTCNNLKELFDFDKTSGQISNFVDLELNTDTCGGYGLSFSPDNSKLYYTDTKNVYQYDLSTGIADSIRSSKEPLSSSSLTTSGLQLGPDGKIYVARTGNSFLAVINNPNQQGLSCDFQDNAVSLNSKLCSLGLPNLIDSYAYTNEMVDCSLGTNEDFEFSHFRIFPNPISRYATLEFANFGQDNHILTLYDTRGRVVKTIRNITTDKLIIDTGDLTGGLYFFQLHTDMQVRFTGKLTIK